MLLAFRSSLQEIATFVIATINAKSCKLSNSCRPLHWKQFMQIFWRTCPVQMVGTHFNTSLCTLPAFSESRSWFTIEYDACIQLKSGKLLETVNISHLSTKITTKDCWQFLHNNKNFFKETYLMHCFFFLTAIRKIELKKNPPKMLKGLHDQFKWYRLTSCIIHEAQWFLSSQNYRQDQGTAR